jgi:hypothetical protein
MVNSVGNALFGLVVGEVWRRLRSYWPTWEIAGVELYIPSADTLSY